MKTTISQLLILTLFSCSSETKTIISDTVLTETVVESPTQEINPDTSTLVASNPKDILEYYILLRDKKLVEPYNFTKINNVIKCFSVDDNEISYLYDLDIQNGYLSIMDDGTGAGRAFTELALFKRSNGKAIIALNTFYIEVSGMYEMVTDSELKFYEYNSGNFKNITSTCFKNKVYSTSFLKPSYAGEEEIEFNYILPKKGTIIKALLNQEYLTYCKSLARYKNNMDKELFEKISDKCLVCDQVVKNSISIPFNKETGKFTFID
jgi:hypothetical protein